jgi:hypothetical protein
MDTVAKYFTKKSVAFLIEHDLLEAYAYEHMESYIYSDRCMSVRDVRDLTYEVPWIRERLPYAGRVHQEARGGGRVSPEQWTAINNHKYRAHYEQSTDS